MLRKRWPLLVPALAPVLVLLLLRVVPAFDLGFESADFHLVAVTLIAGFALLVAAIATRVAIRSDHFGPVWLAAGCLAVGILLLGHGLTTPGINDRPFNQWVVRLPYLAIIGFAVCLTLAGRPRNARTSHLATRHPALLLGSVGLACGALDVVVVGDSNLLHGTAEVAGEGALRWALVVVGVALFALATRAHWRRWQLGRDPVQYALVLAATLSAAALLSLGFGRLWRISWWDYHGFLFAGFGGAVYAVWVRYQRTRQVTDVLASTFDGDPMIHIVDGYPEALKVLVRAVEVKDTYTHGHSARTADLSVRLGLRLGLDAATLRALARGAYLHDVGKIAIPDAVLNKPGLLTAAERAVIETHPTVGHELVVGAPQLREALPVILHHHERWDGTGYPAGLVGQDIPLLARVAAVADVWDALTSDRSYRAGVAPEVALAHLLAGRGRHFDATVVDAFLALAADWGYAADGPGDADIAWQAAETCHDVSVTNRA